MKINLKQPKYLVPLVALPLLCLVFFLYHNATEERLGSPARLKGGINTSVGEVSPQVRKKALSDKLDAYLNKYKQADGESALVPLAADTAAAGASAPARGAGNPTDLKDAAATKAVKSRLVLTPRTRLPRTPPSGAGDDRELQSAIERLAAGQDKAPPVRPAAAPPPAERDPMQLFRQQMAYMDSMRVASDPAAAALEARRASEKAKAERLRAGAGELAVEKADSSSGEFNTLRPQSRPEPIMAAIDEDLTGYAGSRIRLRLLSDIRAGGTLIKSGTSMYALLSGFSQQRVTLAVRSLFYQGSLLPVNLEIYDLDGLRGLYVPDSRFRDFTRDLSSNTIQGVSIDGSTSQGSQFLMSTAGKMFQSASSAVTSAIRKNKARIKFNSYIYLVDQHALSRGQ